MSRQYWQETLAWATSTGTAIANTGTETILIPNVTIPANYLQDGRALRIRAFGSYGTTATPTLQFRVRWGGVAGTVMAATTTVTCTSATGGGASMTAMWSAEVIIQVRTNGSSGTAMTNGEVILYQTAAVTAATATTYGLAAPFASGSTGGTTPATATCDFTADTALSFTAQWGTANAANSIQCLNYSIESFN